jgi:hypothetical protein
MHTMQKYEYYKIRHRSGIQQYDRKSVMQYLGIVEESIEQGNIRHLFNARPTAGTQELYDSDIISAELVPEQKPYIGARW